VTADTSLDRADRADDVPGPSVRTIEPDELAEWLGVVRTAMLGSILDHDTVEEYRRTGFEVERCLAAVAADGRLCGAAHAFGCELTVPGGTVAAAGVTHVGVLPTHRRQGHLTRLMRTQLDDVAQRGEPVAVLVAAEYPIYGRYGYGPATEACSITLDATALAAAPNGGWREPPVGSVELVDTEAFLPAVSEVYEQQRRRTPGHITWRQYDYDSVAGVRPSTDGTGNRAASRVVWRDDAGRIQGVAVYTVRSHWDANRPRGELRANPVVAATDEAERELVRYLISVDWISTVALGLRPIDDPLPLWLHDGRAAALGDRSDHVWARILDVPAALSARRYAAAGQLVIEVNDPLGYATGRFALDGGPDGASCTPTTGGADIVVPATALGAAYLGGISWARLAAAGWVDEARPGAAAAAAAMFGAPRVPWCAHTF
jgi:predicted acetyltransferase